MALLNWKAKLVPLVLLGALAGDHSAGHAQAVYANPPLSGIISTDGAAATPFAKVVAVQAGWTLDQMLLFTDQPAPITNPGGCTVTTNGYITNPADSGHTLFNTMLLSALLNAREVQLVVFGCYLDRPRIVSVSIR
jgi:hypothetical protein